MTLDKRELLQIKNVVQLALEERFGPLPVESAPGVISSETVSEPPTVPPASEPTEPLDAPPASTKSKAKPQS